MDDQGNVQSMNLEFTSPIYKRDTPLFTCLYSNLLYPAKARENGVQGVVKLNIKIDKKGKFEIVSILNSVDPMLDAEACRQVYECSNWTPATFKGQNIDLYSIFEVSFKLM